MQSSQVPISAAASTAYTDDAATAVAALGDFVVTTDFVDLPDAVVTHAKHVIADTIACTVRGSSADEMTALTERLTERDSGGAAILRAGFPHASVSTAAFLNADAACFSELDEGARPTGHPAVHVLPVEVAFAQDLRASGRELIAAFVLGYEVQARIQRAGRLRPNVHCHGNLGNAGAMAAVGKLLRWDAVQLTTGINAVASFAAPTTYSLCDAGATVRNAAPAFSAQQALTWRHLVESGFTAYEGTLGEVFGEILGDAFASDELTRDLGRDYALLGNYIKFHATCGHAHAALDALADALGAPVGPERLPWRLERPFEIEDVERIEVATRTRAAELGGLPRANRLSAQFSIPYALAAAVVRGAADVSAFEPEALADERIWRLAERISIQGEEALEARYPAETAAELEIVLADGRRLTGRCANPYGNPLRQASPADIEEKFHRLFDASLAPEDAADLWRRTLALDRADDVATLFGPHDG